MPNDLKQPNDRQKFQKFALQLIRIIKIVFSAVNLENGDNSTNIGSQNMTATYKILPVLGSVRLRCCATTILN